MLIISRSREFFTITNFFTLICTVFTCILLVQVVVKFAVNRPTSTSEGSDELDYGTFPHVVACIDPLFDETALKKFGYNGMSYFHGKSLDNNHFIGWNGMDGKHNSTYILNKILTGGTLESFKITFRDRRGNNSHPNTQFRMLLYPHGKCLHTGETNVFQTSFFVVKYHQVVLKGPLEFVFDGSVQFTNDFPHGLPDERRPSKSSFGEQIFLVHNSNISFLSR